MRHLRESGISINGGKQKRQLINTGYFHGYKGYRFFKNSNSLTPSPQHCAVRIANHITGMEKAANKMAASLLLNCFFMLHQSLITCTWQCLRFLLCVYYCYPTVVRHYPLILIQTTYICIVCKSLLMVCVWQYIAINVWRFYLRKSAFYCSENKHYFRYIFI